MNTSTQSAIFDLGIKNNCVRFYFKSPDKVVLCLKSLGTAISGASVAYEISLDGAHFSTPTAGAVALTTLDDLVDATDPSGYWHQFRVDTAASGTCLTRAEMLFSTKD